MESNKIEEVQIQKDKKIIIIVGCLSKNVEVVKEIVFQIIQVHTYIVNGRQLGNAKIVKFLNKQFLSVNYS